MPAPVEERKQQPSPAPAETQTTAPAHNVMAEIIERHEQITYRAKRQ